jgi:hypothetical protein
MWLLQRIQLRLKNAAGCISAQLGVTINTQPATPAPTASATQPGVKQTERPLWLLNWNLEYGIDGSTYTNTTGVFTSCETLQLVQLRLKCRGMYLCSN